MRWISIDPGETTGWSYWSHNKRMDAGQSTFEEFCEELEESIEQDGITLIVYEDYKLRASSAKAMIGNGFPAVQVIGVVKWLANKYDVELVVQTPAQKEFFTDERLKLLGLYDRGQQHARDSVRHALYYQFFTGKTRDLKELTRDE